MKGPLIALVLALAATVRAEEDSSPTGLARRAAATLGKELRGRLEAAVQSHSFTGALVVCQTEAPALAQQISARSGLRVGRTALRVRNGANTADGWEKSGLVALQSQLDAGVDPTRAEVVEVLPGELRYLKAIVTEPVCLVCHGDTLDPALQEELMLRYPGDAATGYRPGQLRGAFTVRVPLPK